MSETTRGNHQEEPQEERGAKGSRDTGSDRPSGGPARRPAATSEEDADTGIKPRKSTDPDAPDLQSGGG
ncbi:hypothetical protein [Streptomyces sp. NBC_01497]|uniref:hypothetical protein n=1 Tax=Streptomyces sp. NBC_01497 TaxID=2903885 RepID=UPI002E320FA2|nr:hypothetical protein [Streptomyces sp. NBC_01497]